MNMLEAIKNYIFLEIFIASQWNNKFLVKKNIYSLWEIILCFYRFNLFWGERKGSKHGYFKEES